MSSKVLF